GTEGEGDQELGGDGPAEDLHQAPGVLGQHLQVADHVGQLGPEGVLGHPAEPGDQQDQSEGHGDADHDEDDQPHQVAVTSTTCGGLREMELADGDRYGDQEQAALDDPAGGG